MGWLAVLITSFQYLIALCLFTMFIRRLIGLILALVLVILPLTSNFLHFFTFPTATKNFLISDGLPRDSKSRRNAIRFNRMSKSIESDQADSDPAAAEVNSSSSSEYDHHETTIGLKMNDQPFDVNKHMKFKDKKGRKIVAGKFACDGTGCHNVDASL